MGAGQQPIGEFEQMVLLAVLQRKDDAYGVTIHDSLSLPHILTNIRAAKRSLKIGDKRN